MFKNPTMPAGRQVVKNILSALAVAGFGFMLLNLAFIFDFLFQSLLDVIIKLFTTVDINMAWPWYPPVKHVLFVIIIGIISWFVFRSKLAVIFKAIFLTVPLAVVFLTLGIMLYRWPPVVYSLGGLFVAGLLYYFYRSKQSWLYYYTLILIGLAMLLVGLLGVEI